MKKTGAYMKEVEKIVSTRIYGNGQMKTSFLKGSSFEIQI